MKLENLIQLGSKFVVIFFVCIKWQPKKLLWHLSGGRLWQGGVCLTYSRQEYLGKWTCEG